MSYVIESGVEIPKKMDRSKSGLAIAMRGLEVGQSFLSSESDTRNMVNSAMTYAALKTGCKFISRSENGRFRIWRVS